MNKKLKEIIKSSPLYPLIYPFSSRYMAWRSRRHYAQGIFDSLSPALLVAIMRAFHMQSGGECKGRSYYEFGLFKGFSLWFAEQMARTYKDNEFMCYGFDSFKGLPEPVVDKAVFSRGKGAYSCSYKVVVSHLKNHWANMERIKLYKGFYSTRLFNKLSKREEFLPAAICVIDVDLYESCVPVLEFMKDYLVPGTIIIFDEYYLLPDSDAYGEGRAFKEFLLKYPEIQTHELFRFASGIAFCVDTVG